MSDIESTGRYPMLCDELVGEPFVRLAPHERVEAALLGTLFFHDLRMADVIRSGACEDWFTLSLHRELWRVMHSLASKAIRFDPIVVNAELRALQSTVGPRMADLVYLFEHGAQGAFIPSYCRCLKLRYADRLAKGILAPLDQSTNAEDYAQTLVEKSSELVTLADSITNDGTNDPKSQLRAAMDEVTQTGETGIGLTVGIRSLDAIFRGWRPGEIVICGARPRIGKSAFAVTVAEHVLRTAPESVVFFASVEMRTAEVLKRLVACRSRVSISRMEENQSTPAELRAWKDAIDEYEQSPCYVEHKGMHTPEAVRAAALSLSMRKERIDLIILDHIHHMRADSRASLNESVTRNSHAMVTLAHELEVPILVLAQLNRGIETRDNKEPNLSDLRESGSLEQDGDIVFFLHRENPDSEQTHAFVRKHRRGICGISQLTFKGAYSRFYMTEPKAMEEFRI